MATSDIPAAWLDRHYATPHTLVRVGRRRRLNLVIAGTGTPAVIFAPGLNATALSWARVQRDVALKTRTVGFDKAGIGFSDSGPLPRTASAVVEDLRAALRAAAIVPPYVLAGHSAGGLYMRLYAFRYPEDVGGMVMVDSSNEHQYRRFSEALGDDSDRATRQGFLRTYSRLQQLARAGALSPGTPDYERAVGPLHPALTPAVQAAHVAQRTSPAFWRALRSESSATFDAGGGSASSDEVCAARRPLGDIPVIVLTAAQSPQPRPGDSAVAAETRRRLWVEMHAEFAALSTRGECRTIADAGHNIPGDRPEAVIGAIEEVIHRVRAG